MERVREAIERVARRDTTVLITGESGTGKELAARAVHLASERAAGPFVSLNCAAIPTELFESELFGHRRGAFTGAHEDRSGRFEDARGGTLVLDELGTLQPAMQAKLLRVLDSGEYQPVGSSTQRRADVRIVASTNADLRASVAAGTFRADLYYRIAVFPIEMPALRERLDDLPELVQSILERIGGHSLRSEHFAEPELSGHLRAHDWPGNVRELRNLVERATILAAGPMELRALLPGLIGAQRQVRAERTELGADLTLKQNLDALGRQLIQEALARSGGRKKGAAELLGVDSRNLGYYLRRHGVSC